MIERLSDAGVADKGSKFMNVFSLPPKMTLQFAERARRGDYHHKHGSNIFLWLQDNQEICVIGLDRPTGHIKKLSTREADEKRREYGIQPNRSPSK